jgi:hypothetical protein
VIILIMIHNGHSEDRSALCFKLAALTSSFMRSVTNTKHKLDIKIFYEPIINLSLYGSRPFRAVWSGSYTVRTYAEFYSQRLRIF